jgi:hypothetical protein
MNSCLTAKTMWTNSLRDSSSTMIVNLKIEDRETTLYVNNTNGLKECPK